MTSADTDFTRATSAKQTIDAKAGYLLAVKENPATLYAEMENCFAQADPVECVWEGVLRSLHSEK